jgi:hypothetical protein
MGIMRSSITVLAVGFLTVAPPAATAMAETALTGAGSSPLGGTWGQAEVLNLAPGQSLTGSGVSSISCATAGNCAAVGIVGVGAGDSFAVQGVVVTQTSGHWGTVQAIPGLAALDTGGYVQLGGLSCGAAGDCSAGGSYSNGTANIAFVVSQSGGTWGTAVPVTGVTSLGSTTASQVTAVSCPAAGNCTAAGDYTSAGVQSGFVVSETGGVWGQAAEVPGLIPSFNNVGDYGDVAAVSCASAGNCTAGGGSSQGGWAADETGGVWAAATFFASMNAAVSISCPAAGYCAAVGNYGALAVVADQTAGTWGEAEAIPGAPALAGTGYLQPIAVSCPSAGNCAATGAIVNSSITGYAYSVFVVNETSGNWGTASLVPGLTDPQGEYAYPSSLSCGAVGYCTAGGYYTEVQPTHDVGFVVTETAGTWAAAQTVPGLPVTGHVGSSVQAISCAAAGYCSALGELGSQKSTFAFAANEASASVTGLTASRATLTYGNENAEHVTVAVNSPEGGTPTGTVAVTAGPHPLCTITLAGGAGTCTLRSGSLPPGRYQLTASYSGDASYLASQSPATAITVTPAPSHTSLTLSSGRVTYQHERHEQLTVTVKLAYGHVPAGTVAVKAGRVTLCVITLRGGRGSCRLRNRQLKPGTYRIRAIYRGSPSAKPSDSASKTLKIAR